MHESLLCMSTRRPKHYFILTLGIDGITALLVLGHLVKRVLAAILGLAKGLPLLWYIHLKMGKKKQYK